MSDIATLRRRVEAAKQSIGRIDARHGDYGARLAALLKKLEDRLRETWAEAERAQAAQARLGRENVQLRCLMHELLLAVELGNRDPLADMLRDVVARMTALVEATPESADAKARTGPSQASPPAALAKKRLRQGSTRGATGGPDRRPAPSRLRKQIRRITAIGKEPG